MKSWGDAIVVFVISNVCFENFRNGRRVLMLKLLRVKLAPRHGVGLGKVLTLEAERPVVYPRRLRFQSPLIDLSSHINLTFYQENFLTHAS